MIKPLFFFVILCFPFAVLSQGVPYNVSYDHRALLINGKREIIHAASIHYTRSTPTMWPSLFRAAKEGGIDAITTYVFWDVHEPNPGEYYFEGNADLRTFIKLAQDEGLYVILRVGPYVCAEWNYGGFPMWLKEIPGIVFRDYNEPFMNAMTKFVLKIVDYVDGLWAKDGGPIILAQIENEYGWLEAEDGENGVKYANWAADFALSLNVSVPWMMCVQGDLSQIINTYNGRTGADWIANFTKKFPDQPLFWTEDWDGWFQAFGDPRTYRPVEDIAYQTLRWFAYGGSLHNYYMYHGGTNFGRTASFLLTTTYDYDAPLDEYGFFREPKYSHLSNLHQAMNLIEDVLVSFDEVPDPVSITENLETITYTTSEQTVVFICNQDTAYFANVTVNNTKISVNPYSCTIAIDGVPIYNSATINQADLVYKRKVVVGEGGSFSKTFIGFASEYIGNKIPTTLYQSIPEQLNFTKDKTDYVWYVRNITIPSEPVNPVFSIWVINDYVQIWFDNQHIYNDLGPHLWLPLTTVKANQTYTVTLLISTLGLEEGGPNMEQLARGISNCSVLVGWSNFSDNWYLKKGLWGEDNQVFTLGGVKQVNWNPNIKAAVNQSVTWFAFWFDIPEDLLLAPVSLYLSGMGKGYAYVNGNNIGRYWNTLGNTTCPPYNYTGEWIDIGAPKPLLGTSYWLPNFRMNCMQPSQSYYHVPIEYLVPGKNLVVLFEEIGGDPNTVQLIRRSAGTYCTTGVEEYWAQTTSLMCPPGTYVRSIDFASFGNPTGSCGNFNAGSCNGTSITTSVIENLCLGTSYCVIPIIPLIFGNPCPNLYLQRTLAVQATCA